MFSLFHSVPWVHTAPALFAVVFAFLYLKTKWIYLKLVFLLLWLLLLPNTIYILTDVQRITLHWNSVSMFMRAVLIIQYIILEIIGLVTYLLAMVPLESILHTKRFSQKRQMLAIIMINFLIGFGVVLGRTGYTNSYVVFTRPVQVLNAVLHIVTSFSLLELVIIFGILCNCIYFLFRKVLIRYSRELL